MLDAAKEAVGKLGTVDSKDAVAKAEWLKAASLIESRLGDMEDELTKLVQQHPKQNLRRVKETLAAVAGLKVDVTRRVAALYRL